MSETIFKLSQHVQSEESRTKAIDRFCWVIVFLGLFYSVLFLFFRLYYISALLLIISFTFRYFVFLNKGSRQKIVKSAIIFTTNAGVLVFSIILGYNSGVYLYFFVSPMLIYLIFDFNQKSAIYFNLFVYLFNFLVIACIHHFNIFTPVYLSDQFLEWIFTANFVFTFILCFALIIYFSNNNYSYINKLKESNHHKDILLSEINHRVKNNLSVISSLMELQGFSVKDESAIGILKNTTQRIKTIALLHERLYNSDNFENLGWKPYMEELIKYIKDIYSLESLKVQFRLHIPELDLKIQEALPLALIVNELITNSLKYAFKEMEAGSISIEMNKTESGFGLTIKDNGRGFNLSAMQTNQTLGITLIFSLSKQLGNDFEYTSDDKGTIYNIKFSTIIKD